MPGRESHGKRFTKQDLTKIETLAPYVTMDQLAAELKMSRPTLWRAFKNQPEAQMAYDAGRARAVIVAGSRLMKLINKGSLGAIQFYLRTQAGWVEPQQIELSQSNTPAEAEPELNYDHLSDEELRTMRAAEQIKQKLIDQRQEAGNV